MNEKLNHLIDSFIWRFLNTMKASILPATLLVLLTELQESGSIDCLADPQTWRGVVYAGVVSLITATLAGLDKVQRENVRLEE
jgi:hypothetical protein